MKIKGRWRKWHAVFAITKGEKDQLQVKQATRWVRSKDKLIRTMRRMYREAKGKIELVIRTQEFHEKHQPQWSPEAIAEATKFMRLHRCALPEAQDKLLADPEYRKGLALAMEVLGENAELFKPDTLPANVIDEASRKLIELGSLPMVSPEAAAMLLNDEQYQRALLAAKGLPEELAKDIDLGEYQKAVEAAKE